MATESVLCCADGHLEELSHYDRAELLVPVKLRKRGWFRWPWDVRWDRLRHRILTPGTEIVWVRITGEIDGVNAALGSGPKGDLIEDRYDVYFNRTDPSFVAKIEQLGLTKTYGDYGAPEWSGMVPASALTRLYARFARLYPAPEECEREFGEAVELVPGDVEASRRIFEEAIRSRPRPAEWEGPYYRPELFGGAESVRAQSWGAPFAEVPCESEEQWRQVLPSRVYWMMRGRRLGDADHSMPGKSGSLVCGACSGLIAAESLWEWTGRLLALSAEADLRIVDDRMIMDGSGPDWRGSDRLLACERCGSFVARVFGQRFADVRGARVAILPCVNGLSVV
ncbi:hypothetical protein [Schaalia hyovaginalis]|uniref:Uncharacterized protein n=1 Tax=Schaalia hyovaginalis TaxID=29316 RepID=A0A923E7H6_9ACTO|nr:hypothetical protein [Schaalia hyovaginalis]MBB6334981.1 hypothetical protein [Schaalia hyovaginalis]MDY2669559.1 hypothetical protein [Schaalia hyovaginalis]